MCCFLGALDNQGAQFCVLNGWFLVGFYGVLGGCQGVPGGFYGVLGVANVVEIKATLT